MSENAKLYGKPLAAIEPDLAPAFIIFDLMYRDAANYKTTQAYAFANDLQLTVAQLSVWLDEHMPTDDILAKRYGLPNLAPLDNETDIGNDDDHPYMELTDVSVAESDEIDSIFSIEKDDTPFSVIYQKAISLLTPEGQEEDSLSEQGVLLARIEANLNSLLSNYADVGKTALQARLVSLMQSMAPVCNMAVITQDEQRKQSTNILPSYTDLGLLSAILYSALTYPKGRKELDAVFGELRVADFHAFVLRHFSKE